MNGNVMQKGTKLTFEGLNLDEDVYYPLPNGTGGASHKLPREMNRHDRRIVLRVVERSAKHSLEHPYKGRMGD